MKFLAFRFVMLVASLLCLMPNAHGQGVTRAVTCTKFELVEGYVQGDVKGLSARINLAFNWVEEDAFNQNFIVDYRMVQGTTSLLPSTAFDDCQATAYTSKQTVKGKPGMIATGISFFIPYYAISLESGSQSVDLIFSVENGAGKYSDCYRAPIKFQHTKIVRHPMHEQGFSMGSFNVDYSTKAFGTDNPGLTISNVVKFKYGREASEDDRYSVALMLRSGDGKILYDSRKAANGGDQTKTLSLETFEGKPQSDLSFFACYYDIALEGPAEVEVVYVLLGAEGGPKEIHAQKMMLNIPPSYNFEDQVFTPKALKISALQKGGVSGIEVQYSVAFKQTGIMRNHEKGKYFFYAAIFDGANKLVIAPERAPTIYAGSTQLQDGQMPSADNVVGNGTLFIPLHLLNLPAGAHNLKYALMVSDVNLKTKFPVISTGNIAITKPADVQYLLSLEHLEMINTDYDTEIVPISSNLPELQYVFAVGNDHYYQSEYVRNSLTAIPGSASIHFSDGDQIHLVLNDIDSGFFNGNDLLGDWKIEYAGKGESFYYEVNNSGQVVKLRLKVTKVK